MADEETPTTEAAPQEEAATPNEATFEQVVTAVKTLIAHGQKQEQAIQGIHTTLANINTNAASAASEPASTAEPQDIETMTRAEYSDYLVSRVNKELVKPIADQNDTASKERVSQELKDVSTRYQDFWDFKDEVKDVITKNPGLGVEEAYFIARGTNKDKAKEIDTKRADEKNTQDKEVADKERKEKAAGFGGLLPTSGQAKRSTTLTAKDAANAAWEEVGMGEHLANITN